MQPLQELVRYVATQWPIWLPVLVGGFAVWLLLPRPRPFPAALGALAGGLALFLAASLILRATGVSPEVVLFYAFSALAILGAAMLVTQHNPARAALSFTLVVLSTCGLFLLLAAPFLMAATIIIYAGAIIVTFLFVLMLAQQAGLSDADARSREPALAVLTGFLLLATVLYVLRGYQTPLVDDLLVRIDRALAQETRAAMLPFVDPDSTPEKHLFKQAESLFLACGFKTEEQDARSADIDWGLSGPNDDIPAKEARELCEKPLRKLQALLLSREKELRERMVVAVLPSNLPLSGMSGPPANTPAKEIRRDPETNRPHLPAENSAYLGRSLFTDYLLPVELGGTLLLVATVGAIAIAQRREPRRTT